jgi:hypothetical protein
MSSFIKGFPKIRNAIFIRIIFKNDIIILNQNRLNYNPDFLKPIKNARFFSDTINYNAKLQDINAILSLFSEYKEATNIDVHNHKKSLLLYKRVDDIIKNSNGIPNKQEILLFLSNKIAFMNYISKDFNETLKELNKYDYNKEIIHNMFRMTIVCEIMKGDMFKALEKSRNYVKQCEQESDLINISDSYTLLGLAYYYYYYYYYYYCL